MKALWWRAAVAVFTCGLVAPPASAGFDPSENFSAVVDSVVILQIRILEGEGGVHAAGSRSIRPLSVQITDETGKPVAGAAVSFRLPEQGASGIFGNGLRSELVTSTAEGRAVAWGIEWGKIAGPIEMRITAAKGEARAGTVTSLYITEGSASQVTRKAQAEAAHQAATATPKSRLKWITLTALIAGAAAGGVAAATGASKAPTALAATPVQSAPAASPTSQSTFSLGAPTLTVGKP